MLSDLQMKHIVGRFRAWLPRLVVLLFCVALSAFTPQAEAVSPPLTLSAEERQWLNEHAEELILAPTPDYPPMEIIDQNGMFTGYAGDLFKRIEELLGIKFNVVNLKTWDAIVQAGKRKEIAVTSLAQRTAERDAFWSFTNVFLEVPTIIITGKKQRGTMTLDSLKGLKVGFVKSFAIGDYLKIQAPDLPLREVEENTIGLRMVALGELDALITELPSAVYLIERDGLTGLRVAGDTGFRYRYSIASRNDWPILARLLQRAIDAITPEERQEIYHRWIRLQVEPTVDLRLIGAILAIIVALLGLVVVWNRSLQHQVRRRTAEIEKALAELRLNEQELRRHEERFRTMVTAAPFGIAIIRLADNVFLDVNPAYERMLGIPADEVRGKGFSDFQTPEELEQAKLVQSLLRRDGKVEGIENARMGADGRLHYFISTVCLTELQGESCILTIIADVTETKRLEVELHQVQKMEVVGQLVGGIAHDFNNMLTGIMGQAELLAMKVGDESHSQLARGILQGSKRAADLTRKLLSFSRKGILAAAPIEIHEPLKAAIALLEHSVDKCIRIETAFHESPLTVVGDAILLQNTFLNLGINARDAMPDGGALTFTTSTVTFDEAACRNHPFQLVPGAYVQVLVKDTGCGIPREVLPLIFDPFFTTKESGKGTGLGLSMVFGTVKNHHGAIQVQSEPGVGSEFRVFLPLAPEKPLEVSEPVSVLVSGVGSILVIDDEESVRSMISSLLKSLGYEILVAGHGEAGLEAFQARPGRIDAVILDMIMPGINGRQTFDRLREIDPGVKVIFTSGFHREGSDEEMRQIGGFGFLRKPFQLGELSRLVAEAVRERRGAAKA